MTTLDNNNALLLFRVGPVSCCVPSLPVNSVITPPKLTRPPGSTASRPGIFKLGPHMVSVRDLRYLFGVDKADWKPGRIVIVTLENRSYGFWVDEILDVLEMPTKGWGSLPTLIPHDVFNRTLLLDDNIYLYSEVDKLARLNKPGLLQQYIAQLNAQQHNKSETMPEKNNNSRAVNDLEKQNTRATKLPVPENLTENKKQSTLTDTPQQFEQVVPVDSSLNDAKPVTEQYDVNNKTSNIHQKHQKHQKHQSIAASTVVKKQKQMSTSNTSITEFNIDKKEKIKPVTRNSTAQPHNEIKASHNDSFNNKLSIKAEPHRNPTPTTQPSNHIEKHQQTAATINNTKQPPAPATFNEASSWPLILVAIIILGSIGSFSYYLFYPEKQKPVSSINTKLNSVKIPRESIVEDATTLAENDSSTNKFMQIDETETAENTNKVKQAVSPVTIKNLDTPDTHDTHDIQDTSTLAKQAEPDEVSGKPAISGNSTILTSELPYHAEIAREGNDITIVLHQAEKMIVNINTDLTTPPPPERLAEIIQQTDLIQPTENQPIHSDEFLKIDLLKNTETLMTKKQIQKQEKPTIHKTEIIHLVVKGDTLWAIAQRYVNNPYRYPELARLSKIKNPDRIYPGNRVHIIKYEIRQSNQFEINEYEF